MNHEFQDHPAKLADREPPLGTGNMTPKKHIFNGENGNDGNTWKYSNT
jgi:hypothetical protein